MAELEEQITQVMNDPQLMAQIMSLAQSFGGQVSQQEQNTQSDSGAAMFPDMDPGMLKKLSGFAGKANIDSNQRALLQALRPYVGGHRIQRLERAMRAAKMAGFATSLMGR